MHSLETRLDLKERVQRLETAAEMTSQRLMSLEQSERDRDVTRTDLATLRAPPPHQTGLRSIVPAIKHNRRELTVAGLVAVLVPIAQELYAVAQQALILWRASGR